MTVSRTKLVGIALVIFAATVWLYWPSVHGEFLNGDDREYLRQSARLNSLTWNAVKWAFTTTQPYYHPLPRLSHVLDYQIWGKNAAGHHATSVFLHAFNAALVFGFLWTLLGTVSLTSGERLTVALCVAVVFAIHPLQAESVAWMSGRTQLLCTTFGIACLWAYVAGARRWTVWALFTAALLCKPMAVSLPFVMLAMDYFPLRRHERLGWGRLLREKAVLIGLGAVAAAAAMITESQKGGLMIPLEKIPLSQRLLLMFQSLAFYPWKLVWPEHLSPYYPLYGGPSLKQWPFLVSVLSVGMIAGLVVWAWRRLPALAAGWGAYVMLILPVSGLMPAGLQSVALRYAYVAMLPLLLLGGGAAVWVWRRSTAVARIALAGFLGCASLAFGLCTRNLIPVWHDDEIWWRVPVEEFPDSELANRMLATALLAQGRASEALEYAQRDVEIAPHLGLAHYNLAAILEHVGRIDEAIGQYQQTLRIKPDLVEVRQDLGNALLHSGRANEAIEQYEDVLRVYPDHIEAHINLGNAFLRTGKVQEAVEQYSQAVQIDPGSAEAHSNLGAIYQQMGKLMEAAQQYEQALRSKPDYVEAHYNLGLALEKLGRIPEAIEHYRQALRLRPDYIRAKNALTRLGAGQ
jgi:tetratricopeptide (TPR) repeat protein